MKRDGIREIIRAVFTVGVLLFVGVFSVLLVPRLKLKRLRRPSACASAFPAKSYFVELNGAFSRLSGRRLCNNTLRSEHGLMLAGLKGGAVSSEAVAELTVLDPRRFARGETVVDAVRRMRPDVVLQMVNTGGFHWDFTGRKKCGRSVMFDYGLPSADEKMI